MALTFDVLKPKANANGAAVIFMVSGGWVSSYSPPQRAAEQFKALLRTGKGMGGRDLGVMTEVSQWDFSHFTDSEIEQIQAYLAREQ